MSNVEHRCFTVQQRCELLGIGRATWYRHTSDPLFRARAQAVFLQSCDDALGPILHALVESAQIEGKDGHADRKLYLGMLGIYEQGAAAKRRDEEEKKPTATMSDAELVAHFADRPHLLPPGVQRRLGIDPDAGTCNAPPPQTKPPAEPAKERNEQGSSRNTNAARA